MSVSVLPCYNNWFLEGLVQALQERDFNKTDQQRTFVGETSVSRSALIPVTLQSPFLQAAVQRVVLSDRYTEPSAP